MDKCPVCRLPIDAEHHPQCEIKKALDAGKVAGCDNFIYRPTFRTLAAACGWATYECEASLQQRFELDDHHHPCSLYTFAQQGKEPEGFYPKWGRGVKSSGGRRS